MILRMKIFILFFSFTTFDFVNIPYSGTQALLRDNHFLKHFETNKIFYRPIFIDETTKIKISSGYTPYILDINTLYFAGNYKKFYFAIFSYNAGKFEVIDSFGFKTGEIINPTHIGFILNFPFIPFKKTFEIQKGLGVKVLYVKLKEFSSLAFAIDLSLLKEFLFKEIPLRGSLDIRNLGFSTNKKASPAPYELSFSFSANLNKFIPSTGFSLEENLFSYRLSFLYELNKFLNIILNYDSRRKDLVEFEGLHRVITGFGTGLILTIKRVSLSYSYIPSGILEDLHKIDISISF